MKTLLSALAVGAVAFTMSPALAAPDYGQTLNRVVSTLVLPGYEKLSTTTHALADTLKDACGTEQGLSKSRRAFHAAMDAWQAVQIFRTGPSSIEDRHTRLQFWPDDRGIGGRHLRRLLTSGTEKQLTDVPGDSVAVQGFPALERLLFGDVAPAVEPRDGEKLSRCRTAFAIADNVATIADALKKEMGAPAPYGADAKAAVRGLFGDLITAIEVTYRLKLRAPLGDKKKTRLHKAESWRAERSLKNVYQNVVAMKALYLALYGDGGADDPEHQLIVTQFDTAADEVSRLGDAMGVVFERENGPLQISAMSGTVDSLRELVAVALTSHLQVNLGFNSLDGD